MLSKALGSRTVMSGSISKSKNDPSESLQMMERPLMTPDELKAIPKGSFIVMKTGFHPVQTQLRLYLDSGIHFGKPYILPEKSARKVAYADKSSPVWSITESYPRQNQSERRAKEQQKAEKEAPTHTDKAAESTAVVETTDYTEDKKPTPYNIDGGGGGP